MYSIKLHTISKQIRNCIVATRGDWLFNDRRERDLWLKETHELSVWSGGEYDEIVFKSEQDYMMFMLRWT